MLNKTCTHCAAFVYLYLMDSNFMLYNPGVDVVASSRLCIIKLLERSWIESSLKQWKSLE